MQVPCPHSVSRADGSARYSTGQKACAAKAGRLGGRCSGCNLSAGVRPAPACGRPTGAPLRGSTGVLGRDFRIFEGESLLNALGIFRRQRTVVFSVLTGRRFSFPHFLEALENRCWKNAVSQRSDGLRLQQTTVSQRVYGPSFARGSRFFMPGQAFVFPFQRLFNARGPRGLSSDPADGHTQPRFTHGVKRNDRRTGSASVRRMSSAGKRRCPGHGQERLTGVRAARKPMRRAVGLLRKRKASLGLRKADGPKIDLRFAPREKSCYQKGYFKTSMRRSLRTHCAFPRFV